MTETVVQSLSRVLTLCDPIDCSTQGFPVLHHLQGLLKFMSIESVMLSNHFIQQRLYPSKLKTLDLFGFLHILEKAE